VAAERNSTLVMPVPVELLRFFDKFTPPTPGGGGRTDAESASMADFGGDDVVKEEAEIESGAPLEIPEVPKIPELPQEVSDGSLTADVTAANIDAAEIPKQEAAAEPAPNAPDGNGAVTKDAGA
jgi:hypothetical protein